MQQTTQQTMEQTTQQTMEQTTQQTMEQTTDKQMTLAEFKQWLESMEQEAWNILKTRREKNVESSEIWAHQWVAYKWVLKQLNNVVCE